MRSRKTILLLATSNRGKAAEIQNALRGLPITVLSLAGAGIRDACPEKGATFLENARGKSRFYSRRTGYLTLAEDSGLEIEALGGAPGAYSARFSGKHATDEKNIRKVLRLMTNVPAAGRRARFVCCMVLSMGGRIIKTMSGQVQGRIAFDKKGVGGFGYDPIFYYKPLGKTFAELAPEKKNAVSHRGRALKKMVAFLKNRSYPFTRKGQDRTQRARLGGPRETGP